MIIQLDSSMINRDVLGSSQQPARVREDFPPHSAQSAGICWVGFMSLFFSSGFFLEASEAGWGWRWGLSGPCGRVQEPVPLWW